MIVWVNFVEKTFTSIFFTLRTLSIHVSVWPYFPWFELGNNVSIKGASCFTSLNLTRTFSKISWKKKIIFDTKIRHEDKPYRLPLSLCGTLVDLEIKPWTVLNVWIFAISLWGWLKIIKKFKNAQKEFHYPK